MLLKIKIEVKLILIENNPINLNLELKLIKGFIRFIDV